MTYIKLLHEQSIYNFLKSVHHVVICLWKYEYKYYGKYKRNFKILVKAPKDPRMILMILTKTYLVYILKKKLKFI